MGADERAARGHATLPHVADARIEAWAPDGAACYEEAVAAFVELFVDTDDAPAGRLVRFEIGPATPTELLVLLLEEVLVAVEVDNVVPRAAHVERWEDDRLSGTFSVVPVATVAIVGSVPKGVSYSELSFGAQESGWRCEAIVDV